MQRQAELSEEIARVLKRVEEMFAAAEERRRSTAGRLPTAKTWARDGVAFEGELFTHQGSLWQARRTTGQPPGGAHWVCLAPGASKGQRHEVDIVASDQERERAHDDIGEAIAKLRTEVENKFATREERLGMIPGKLRSRKSGRLRP
jgi:hypothetical protein